MALNATAVVAQNVILNAKLDTFAIRIGEQTKATLDLSVDSGSKDLFTLMNISWVPFSRYIFNTVLVSVAGTAGHLFLASLAAYALAKIKFPGRDLMFQTVQLSLMFNATVTAITSFILMSALHWLDSYWALFPA